MLAKESHRWREIVFHSRGNVSTLEAILKHQDFKGLHVLRKIHIAEDMSPNPNLLGNSRAIGAPNLTSVVLCSSAENLNAMAGYISLTHITYLHLTINYDQRLRPVASVIASSPGLNYLHLSLNIAWHHIDSLQPGCTMDLPHLSRLSVSANPRCLWHFLSRMRVPALTHLHVSEEAPLGHEAGSPNVTDVDEFLDVVPPALEALTVQCMDFPQLKSLITATEPRKINLTDIVIGENDGDEWNIHTFLEDVVSCAGYTSRMQEVAIFNQVQHFEGADDGFIEAILDSLHRAAEGSPLFEDPRPLRIDIYSDLPIPEEAMDEFDPDTLPQCIDVCLYEDWTSPVDKWRGYFLDPDPEEDLSGFFSI
ncbi:hypothetical protein D9611_004199 [Ephemerocybe angulata]|uniref:Uncharacterized protein n=1 Tax=Ephemerocybe angulata TaxID=980116 RepID=A0A8H5BL15_9AGAR|nr:hypothetical protein D9611_004199 [Tulosesus angulatus]